MSLSSLKQKMTALGQSGQTTIQNSIFTAIVGTSCVILIMQTFDFYGNLVIIQREVKRLNNKFLNTCLAFQYMFSISLLFTFGIAIILANLTDEKHSRLKQNLNFVLALCAFLLLGLTIWGIILNTIFTSETQKLNISSLFLIQKLQPSLAPLIIILCSIVIYVYQNLH